MNNLTLGRAIAIAAQAHADQLDKNGVDPYILHPLAVMDMVHGEDAKIVAVLHDVLEDTQVTAADLEAAGATPEQLSALDALTHRLHEPYRKYIIRALNHSPLSREVKIADNQNNFNIMRFSRLPPYVKDRLRKKYESVSDLINLALFDNLDDKFTPVE